MSRKPKTAKFPGFIRTVFARSLTRCLDQRYDDHITDKPLALHEDLKRSGYTISKSRIQRYMIAETGATIDNVEAIARVMDVPTYQMLIPDELAAEKTASKPVSQAKQAVQAQRTSDSGRHSVYLFPARAAKTPVPVAKRRRTR